MILSCNPDDINPWGCDLIAVIYFSPPFFDDEWLEWFWFCFVCRCRYIISSSVHSFSSLVFFQVLLLSTFSCCVAVWRVHLYLACFATISSQSQAVEQPGGAAPFMRNQPAFDFVFMFFWLGFCSFFSLDLFFFRPSPNRAQIMLIHGPFPPSWTETQRRLGQYKKG